jgi:HEAT repeat protein
MLRRLDDPDPKRRSEAAGVLGEFGPLARAFAPQLEAALNDRDPLVRSHVAEALASIDPANPRALAVLLAALDDRSIEVLTEAIAGIKELGAGAAAAVPKLKRITERDDLISRNSSADPTWESIYLKVQAAEALVAVAPNSDEGLSALIRFLRKSVKTQELEAADALATPSPSPGERPSALVQFLSEYDTTQIFEAAEALGRLGPSAAAAAPALAAIVNGKSRDGRRRVALEALIRITPDHEAVSSGLASLMVDDPNGGAEVGEDGEVEVDDMGDADILARLSLMGPRARGTIPVLIRILEARGGSENLYDLSAVGTVTALARIGTADGDAPIALAKAMELGSRGIKGRAAMALLSMGADASPSIPDLIRLLEARKVWGVVEALAAIGPKARDASPVLLKWWKTSTQPNARIAVALLRIDPANHDAVEARLSSLRSNPSLLGWAIANGALGRRTPEADGYTRLHLRELNSAVAHLDRFDDAVSSLGSVEFEIQKLADLGAGAADAVPRLTELTRHPEPLVRRAAVNALKRIEMR